MDNDWDPDSILFDEQDETAVDPLEDRIWDHNQDVPIDTSKDLEIDDHIFMFERHDTTDNMKL